jgi:hypothetical protein
MGRGEPVVQPAVPRIDPLRRGEGEEGVVDGMRFPAPT